MSSTGKAALTIEGGRNLKNVELFGKQDPYVVLEVGGKKYQTEVAKNGGSNPVWNQTFEVPATGQETVSLRVVDEELTTDELIGQASMSLAKAKAVGQDRQDVQLFTKDGRDAGHIIVSARFAESGYAGGYPAGGHCGDHHHHHNRE